MMTGAERMVGALEDDSDGNRFLFRKEKTGLTCVASSSGPTPSASCSLRRELVADLRLHDPLEDRRGRPPRIRDALTAQCASEQSWWPALAERLGRAYLDDTLGDAASEIRLVSAGTNAVVDSAMHPHSALVLAGLGAEAGDFTARQLTEALPAEADLILTMTRRHCKDVLEAAPRGLARTFTLREAAALLDLVDPTELPGVTVAERARALVKQLAEARSRRPATDDDIRDPIGRPVEVHEEVGEAIAAALLPVLRRLADLQ
jgi:protein-tyrosine-phosphatase